MVNEVIKKASSINDFSSALFVTFTSINLNMKRLFAAILVFFLASLAVIYFIIPQELKVSTITVVRTNERAVFRSLMNEQNWKKWWPVRNGKNDANITSGFYLNGYSFKPATKQLDGMEVIIANKDYSSSTLLNLSALSTDSVLINWTATLSTSSNPFTKLNKFFEAKKMKQSMEEIIGSIQSFAKKPENLYGIKIIQTTVTDTILVVIKNVQKEKPTEAEIYSYINTLRKYIASEKAKETDYPMLHISYSNETKSYELMVAMPVDRRLPGNDSIIFKRMVPGNILYTEVKGGEATVEEAMNQMENFVFDNQKVSPALPYQLLVTDRTREKDTTKWVTRIYYPIL